ncbi:MAG: hypothetical protein N5P05_002804 [Chroococcopsis gigantea SAG 12.99]|jgi:hypothetical protein|nr:family 10 glycosylhydrolase [Chlorogloea purpurea SAG 13.99]MDV3001198.1 hypothetical protein [Chroococcopsis gigantea SAG 12.99]
MNKLKVLLSSIFLVMPLLSAKPSYASIDSSCQFSADEVTRKQALRQQSLTDENARQAYSNLLREQGQRLARCREQNWPDEQAIWLRLYPCDVRAGSIDAILDRIVDRGYNSVYLEVFYDSMVLLPANDNPTVWPSVVDIKGQESTDLLAQTIEKGHERGLKVYAWLFSLNFGYLYAQKPENAALLARNGKGQDSTGFVLDQSQAFVDPYNSQARSDYSKLLNSVLKRRPDGVLFDYIRYPRGSGEQSTAAKVKDLWIYGPASRQALLNRALNDKGKFLIDRYLTKGDLSSGDLQEADKKYPDQDEPLWEGQTLTVDGIDRLQNLKLDLWYLSVSHAAQGVIDYLTFISGQVKNQGIQAGAVFFPDGNQTVGATGFDSRLQPWDRFPSNLLWNPMSYAVCNDAACVVAQVQRVVDAAKPETKIIPAIAGQWGRVYNNRPSLEEQTRAIYSKFYPRIRAISHFAFSWQEPEIDKERRFCKRN